MRGLRLRSIRFYAAIFLAWGAVAPSASFGDDEADRDERLLASLPEGLGKEETFYACHGCHSFRLVAQQGLSRAHWDDLLDWMVEEQGMNEIEGEDRKLILDYLAEHYNQDRIR